MKLGIAFLAAAALATVTCIRPARERAQSDLEVGQARGSGIHVAVQDGQAQVLSLADNQLTLWAQAPTLAIDITADSNPTPPYQIELQNCMPRAEMRRGTAPLSRYGPTEPRVCRFVLETLDPGEELTLTVATADAADSEPFVFAVLGDIQTALDSADELFRRINAEPDIRFVMSTGDLVENATVAEYDLLTQQLEVLDVPLFSTVGNHELTTDYDRWIERFGRLTIHFTFKGVVFSFVDSGNASIDPINYDRLAGWLTEARDRVHIFGTHYPAIDPIGLREASFRSRREASKLLTRLADGRVDLTLYGHIHCFYEFENAGIPAYISGGGGAIPERFDGFGRHFLRITVDPDVGVESVTPIPVDG